MSGRRDFLRGLVSLPLIGGGVTLIGQPSAVAEPVTDRLMLEYIDWLKWERHAANRQFYGAGWTVAELRRLEQSLDLTSRAFLWHHGDVLPPPPSARAALVMSAVGFEWREGASLSARRRA